MPGAVLRFDPTGDNPSETGLTEFYEVPFENPGAEVQDGYSPRGMDIDRNGVVWTPLASGHMASFDRSKCTGPLNGPDATGQHCPEGWDAVRGAHAPDEGHRRLGQHRGQLLHVGRPVRHPSGWAAACPSTPATRPRACSRCATASGVTLRVPYPLGFYTKWMDGRIDDPDLGWKGRGVWGDLEHPGPVPRRDRRGHPEQGGALPDPPRRAGEVGLAFRNPRVDAAERGLRPPGGVVP